MLHDDLLTKLELVVGQGKGPVTTQFCISRVRGRAWALRLHNVQFRLGQEEYCTVWELSELG